MYKASTLTAALFGLTPLVAWRQNDDPEKLVLDEVMTVGTSGRYFQDAHPVLTLSNLQSIAPKFSDYTYTAWSNSVDYTASEIVSYNSVNYVCLLDHEVADEGAQTPGSSPTYWSVWTESNAFSRWLTEKTQGYILATMDDFLDTKKWSKTAKSIIEERPLFDGAQNLSEVTVSAGKVVGLEIRVNKHTSVLAKLGKVGFQFDSAGTFTLSLFHSSRPTAVETQSITVTTANRMEIFDLNWELPYISSYDTGGSWRIEYEQSSAPGNSINKAKDWGHLIGTRNGYRYNSWKLWSPYLDVHPYKVDVADRLDPSKRLYEYTDNYGMNLIVSVYCDYTDFFVRQASAFKNAIILGVGKRMLRELALNPNSRINQKESVANYSKEELLYEIDGNPQGRATGIGLDYDKALKAVIIDTEGIDAVCLPCSKKRMRMRTT